MPVSLKSTGGGSVTLEAPNTASNRTLTLPDGDGAMPIMKLETAKTASGTSVDFTGIPSWVKRITVMLDGVSTNGTSIPLIQLGDSGGIETTGYVGTAAWFGGTNQAGGTSFSAGFAIFSQNASHVQSGSVIITNLSGNSWVAMGAVGGSGTAATFMYATAGSKTLSATLDRIRLTTVNGTDTFDAGNFNILYEG